MALSLNRWEADGIQSRFDITYGYLSRSHVFAFVDDRLVAYKWTGAFQIELLVVPQPGVKVTIRRLTDRANRITTYTDGQTLLAESLNAGDLQTFYIAQEMIDQLEEAILNGDVSVLNPDGGYITAQWIQDQLAAGIAAAEEFQIIDAAIQNEAVQRAIAIGQEAFLRAEAIAEEASARAENVLSLTQADLEAGQRLDTLESNLNDPDNGVLAKIATLEEVAVDLEGRKANASVTTALAAELEGVEALVYDETAARVSQCEALATELEALSATVGAAEADIVEERNARIAADEVSASQVSGLLVRIDEAEGGIANTNAAIFAEQAARATGDAANATTIEQNRAVLDARQWAKNLIVNADFAGPWTAYWGAAWDGNSGVPIARGMNTPGFGGSGGLNVHFTTAIGTPASGTIFQGARVLPQFRPKVSPGEWLYISALVGMHRLAGVSAVADFYDASGNFFASEPVGYTAALPQHSASNGNPDNMVRVGGFVQAPAGAASVAVEPRAHCNGEGSPYLFSTAYQCAKVPSGWTRPVPYSDAASAVTFLREALATGDASVARLLLAVNTNSNVASVEAVAQEGSGTWNGSAITLNADMIRLMAKAINFGSNTVFEDADGSIYTVNNNKRLRMLGPFGAAGDLVIWFGPTSVPLYEETKTNGYFSFATDGKVYYGNAELGGGSGASRAKTATGSAVITTGAPDATLASVVFDNVQNPSVNRVPYVEISGDGAGGPGTGGFFHWHVRAAPLANPSDFHNVVSGEFRLEAGSGGETPTVAYLTQPNQSLRTALRHGQVLYSLVAFRFDGSTPVGVRGTLNIENIPS
jgi:hypothetical protein